MALTLNKSISLNDTISGANSDLMIISHRGEWESAPENSIESMLLAAKVGADMVEIDVQKTNQGRLFLMHDDTTDRMTNRIGATTDVRNEEFETLLLRNRDGGDNATLTNTQVPTLRAALEAVRDKIHLNIDTKHRRDLEAVGELVNEMGMQEQVLIKMIVDPVNPDVSILDASWYKDLIFMPVLLDPKPGKMANEAVEMAKLFDAKILEISFHTLNELKETHKELRELGVRLWCNTLNEEHPLSFSDERALTNPEEVWGTLIRSGIGAIQTDNASSLSAYIKRD